MRMMYNDRSIKKLAENFIKLYHFKNSNKINKRIDQIKLKVKVWNKTVKMEFDMGIQFPLYLKGNRYNTKLIEIKIINNKLKLQYYTKETEETRIY